MEPLVIGYKVKFSNKVQFGNMVAIWIDAWSMEGVTAYYGHPPERHVTFWRGGLQIIC